MITSKQVTMVGAMSINNTSLPQGGERIYMVKVSSNGNWEITS